MIWIGSRELIAQISVYKKKIKIWIFYSLSINLSGTHFYAPYQMQCFGSIFNVITFHSNNKVVLNKKNIPLSVIKKKSLVFFLYFFLLITLPLPNLDFEKFTLLITNLPIFIFLSSSNFMNVILDLGPNYIYHFFRYGTLIFARMRKDAGGKIRMLQFYVLR